MRMILMPGYKSLFGTSTFSYEEVLEDVPSEIIIMLLINLNAELNTSESHIEKQTRLLGLVAFRFTKEQREHFTNAFTKYIQLAPSYDGSIFGRRYLLAMLLKEFSRNHQCEVDYNNPIHEFNFLIAYLMLVDEVNENDSIFLKGANEANDNMQAFPLLWAGLINQYEFNQSANAAFELFKLLSFSKYAYVKYKPFLKELIQRNKFPNLSQFLSSLYQITYTTLNENSAEPLRKLYFIKPQEGTDTSHLKSQTLNFLLGRETIKISDIRKYPLFETERGFMVIDEDLYKRKLYKGPMFELHKHTALEKEIKFEDYKKDISIECFENICFAGIIKAMVKSKFEILHFDIGHGTPDLYYRNKKKFILIEFKDYLFPDTLVNNSDFTKFKKYLDERFILSDKTKGKGITQLSNNISNLINGTYSFDSSNKEILSKENYCIYPVICHTDFMFTMPGINEYLNTEFAKQLIERGLKKDAIRETTLINLETLFDYLIRGGNFVDLMFLIDRYWKIIKNRKQKFSQQHTIDNFLSTQVSFDEMYGMIFQKEMAKNAKTKEEEQIEKIITIAGIEQYQLDEIL
jgi:hypothetical protein